MYIYREIEHIFLQRQSEIKNFGFILSGIVGCGKTTFIQKILENFKSTYQVFQFTGDDIFFRKNVSENSRYILETVATDSAKKYLVFVDEVQKTEDVFDALKIAFDSGQISFIVSGSNPAYLSTVAKKRLQRRAHHLFMLPLSLPEILNSKQIIEQDQIHSFPKIMLQTDQLSQVTIPHFSRNKKIENVEKLVELFLNYGGLPLSVLSETDEKKMSEIRLSTERGFDLMSVGNSSNSEVIKLELAQLNSKEFTYQNILNLTRLRRRDDVNVVIDALINHGYLVKKKPMLLADSKSSYLSVYSYIDPGILTYLSGRLPIQNEKGFWLEGYIHSRIDYYIQNHFFKTQYGYYKPHVVDVNKKIKYSPGEIDFVIQRGQKYIPIEVKLTFEKNVIDISMMKKFMNGELKNKILFGIVIYGGVPHIDSKNKILYWPYWLV